MLYAIVGLLFLLADQFLKFWTVAHVELNAYPGVELIPGVLNLTYIKNTGIAFGLFGSMPMLRWILLILLAAFTLFIVISLATRYLRTGFARWTGVLLLTGLLGNGVDRAIYGYVVDMLEPKLGSISWPIFNIADALILIFGILFCIALLSGGFGKPKRKKKRASAARRPQGQSDRPKAQSAERRPHREGERPARRPRPEPEAERRAAKPQSAPAEESAAERGAHVTPAEVTETLRRSGSAVRPTEERAPQREPIEPVKVEPTPVQTVERPAPKAESAPKPEAKAEAKTSGDELDLDAILAEFK